MRPRRLELEGFASFRERVVVDFADAELFALSGPTGAGKSSVIDAMIFALYGVVPRYGSQVLVWPVISQGMNEARVRLVFAVGDVEYTAVRVVRRTGAASATTKEARLEDASGRTIAGNADELSAAVARLIGLPFKHFTRCVVLPQGEFADFLHAKPGERQDLLVQLLGLEVYRRIAQAAYQRSGETANRAALIAERLDGELAGATAEAVAAATARLNALDVLLRELESGRPELDRLALAHRRANEAADAAAARATSLESVKPPAGLERLARRVTDAVAARETMEKTLDRAVKLRERAQKQREALPERARLEVLLERHARRAALETQLAAAVRGTAAAESAATAAAASLEEATSAYRETEESLHTLRRERAAFHLAEQLSPGDTCPVCLRKLRTLPHHEAPGELETAQRAYEAARNALDRVRARAEDAARILAVRQSEHAGLAAQLDAVAVALREQPSADEATEQLTRVDGADEALREARLAEEDARKSMYAAKAEDNAVSAAHGRASAEFDRARDALAGHAQATPPPKGRGLLEDWTGLLDWARARAAEQRAAAEALKAEARQTYEAFETRIREQRAALAVHGIDPGPTRDPRDACADACARASAEADRLARDYALAGTLREERTRLERAAGTARELAKLLDARHFERWLMGRALHLLVADATRVLRELSGGAYSLALDAKNEFLVVDHRNADEKRMARTLSGGETFLASLALALALAEHVADLSSGGLTRLDALILDEGFGSLDAETLDTVATAIEELGARGRMVGLVTHVRDLAERVPVRFEVRKVGGVSTIEKVIV